MQIRQIQVANNALEDRLHLRIATQDHEEIGVFITRRLLRELWHPLMTLLLERMSTQQSPAVTSQRSASSPSFDQPFSNENPRFPLGETPLLASEVNLEMTSPELVKLTFREGQSRNISLSLDNDLMHAFCAMLRTAAEQAAWDLPLEYTTQRPTPSLATTPSTPRSSLH